MQLPKGATVAVADGEKFNLFRNAGDETALLLAIVGGHDPGKVGWPAEMKERVRGIGYELGEDGLLRELPRAAS